MKETSLDLILEFSDLRHRFLHQHRAEGADRREKLLAITADARNAFERHKHHDLLGALKFSAIADEAERELSDVRAVETRKRFHLVRNFA